MSNKGELSFSIASWLPRSDSQLSLESGHVEDISQLCQKVTDWIGSQPISTTGKSSYDINEMNTSRSHTNSGADSRESEGHKPASFKDEEDLSALMTYKMDLGEYYSFQEQDWQGDVSYTNLWATTDPLQIDGYGPLTQLTATLVYNYRCRLLELYEDESYDVKYLRDLFQRYALVCPEHQRIHSSGHQTDDHWPRSGPPCGICFLKVIRRRNGLHYPQRYDNAPQIEIVIMDDLKRYTPSANSARLMAVKNLLIPDFIDCDKIKWLLNSCSSGTHQHTECLPDCAKQKIILESFCLVDAQALCIQNFGSYDVNCLSFVALSYVQGSCQLHHVYKNQLRKLSHPGSIDLARLPRTFADAIILAKRLDFRYIWIDALCILSNSEDDKRYQKCQRKHIFTAAQLTISAAGFDACEPLWGVTQRRRPIQEWSLISIGNRSGFAVCDPSHPIDNIRSSMWSKLGWTFQEEYLSRRILYIHYASWEWSCDHVRCNESEFPSLMKQDMTQPPKPETEIKELHFRQGFISAFRRQSLEIPQSLVTECRATPASPQPITLIKSVNDQASDVLIHLALMIHRSFDFEDDVWSAFSGITDRLEQRTRIPSIAGIPLVLFNWAVGLIFYPPRYLRRRMKDDSGKPLLTWSMMGYKSAYYDENIILAYCNQILDTVEARKACGVFDTYILRTTNTGSAIKKSKPKSQFLLYQVNGSNSSFIGDWMSILPHQGALRADDIIYHITPWTKDLLAQAEDSRYIFFWAQVFAIEVDDSDTEKDLTHKYDFLESIDLVIDDFVYQSPGRDVFIRDYDHLQPISPHEGPSRYLELVWPYNYDQLKTSWRGMVVEWSGRSAAVVGNWSRKSRNSRSERVPKLKDRLICLC